MSTLSHAYAVASQGSDHQYHGAAPSICSPEGLNHDMSTLYFLKLHFDSVAVRCSGV